MRIIITTIILYFCLTGTRASAQVDTLPNFAIKNNHGRIITDFYNNYDAARQISVQRSHDSSNNFVTVYSLLEPAKGRINFVDSKAPNDHMYYRLFIQVRGSSYLFTPGKLPVIDNEPLAILRTPEHKEVKPEEPKESNHIYTDDDGNVRVDLPLFATKKYLIRFYDDERNFLFELSGIKENPLTIDKSNFLHAGWFSFELFEEGVLREKKKILLRDN